MTEQLNSCNQARLTGSWTGVRQIQVISWQLTRPALAEQHYDTQPVKQCACMLSSCMYSMKCLWRTRSQHFTNYSMKCLWRTGSRHFTNWQRPELAGQLMERTDECRLQLVGFGLATQASKQAMLHTSAKLVHAWKYAAPPNGRAIAGKHELLPVRQTYCSTFSQSCSGRGSAKHQRYTKQVLIYQIDMATSVA